jgi:hypothetical protein
MYTIQAFPCVNLITLRVMSFRVQNEILRTAKKGKGKTIPVTGRGGP